VGIVGADLLHAAAFVETRSSAEIRNKLPTMRTGAQHSTQCPALASSLMTSEEANLVALGGFGRV
jgi:hypothetical protein